MNISQGAAGEELFTIQDK
uniref:Uncharacterized protein n=1 Tax=Anguilla anguilla TaxID=7936 RepID=A0A0E9UQV4_ANGAN